VRVLVLPEDLRSELKSPLGRLYKGNGVDCIEAMGPELEGIKTAAVGDMTAHYLLEAYRMPDLIIVDHRTKRMPTPDHVKRSLLIESYRTVEVVNPPATLSQELIDQIQEALAGHERVKIVVDGEEDLATLPAILYAPLGSAVIYGQPSEGSVLVKVTEDKKREIKKIMDRMIWRNKDGDKGA
jgi:uncharacterized protein (UPF0218 family)